MPSTLARGLADEARHRLRADRPTRTRRDEPEASSETPPAGRRPVQPVMAVCARLALPVLAAASVTEVVTGWGGPAIRTYAGAVAFVLWLSFPLSWGRPFTDWFVFGRQR